MTEDRIVLAVECGYCSLITAVPVYNGALHIARCGNCGRAFQAAKTLVSQYQASAERIVTYDTLLETLMKAKEAMALALEHWGRKAGKEALTRALSAESHSP